MNTWEKLNRHLTLLNLSRGQVGQIQRLIRTWVESSGVEFTIRRLKNYKLMLLDLLAKGSIDFDDYPWVSHRHGLPSGPLRILYKDLKRHQLRRSLAVLNSLYLFYLDEKGKEKKIQELLSTINAPYQGSYFYPEGFAPFRYNKIPKNFGIKLRPSGLSTSKPILYNYISSSKWLSSLVDTFKEALPYQRFLEHPSKPDPTEQIIMFGRNRDIPLGEMVFLNERGGKVRPICSPISELQVVFHEFHIKLMRILSSIPEDYTLDQEKGARWAQQKLSSGLKLYSIDLKSATDRFPRWLQLRFLKESGFPSDWLNAFEVTSSTFVTYRGERHYYNVGQPMGLYGSFPLLALGQHGLVRMAAYLLGKSAHDSYAVLGDDIVISDPDIAERYISLLNEYDIPVSLDKCITSDKVAEFAGFIIREDDIHKGVKPPKDSYNLDNYLSYIKTLGNFPKTLSSRLKYTLAPLVLSPRENGGLGLNPYGLPLEDRMLYFDPLYQEERKQSRSFKNIQKLTSSLFRDFIKLPQYLKGVIEPYYQSVNKMLSKELNNLNISYLLGITDVTEHLNHFDIFLDSVPVRDLMTSNSFKSIKGKYPYWFMQNKESLPTL